MGKRRKNDLKYSKNEVFGDFLDFASLDFADFAYSSRWP